MDAKRKKTEGESAAKMPASLRGQSDRPAEPDDLRECQTNITGFFRILAAWDAKRERPPPGPVLEAAGEAKLLASATSMISNQCSNGCRSRQLDRKVKTSKKQIQEVRR